MHTQSQIARLSRDDPSRFGHKPKPTAHLVSSTRETCFADHSDKFVVVQVRIIPGAKLMYMPQQGMAHSLYDSVLDDHDGGASAGVASGFDPSGGKPEFQFGAPWVSSPPKMSARVNSQIASGGWVVARSPIRMQTERLVF